MTHPDELQTRRVVFTGFMGSGKSTVGRLLAQHLGWTFVDLDSAVEERCGQSVSALFAEHGEQHFRSQESAALSPLLQSSRMVIALGGGAPETASNRHVLQQTLNTAVVYLEAPFQTLHARCTDQAKLSGASLRPLLADWDSAFARFSSRQQLYQAIATIRLDTTALTPKETVDAVMALLP